MSGFYSVGLWVNPDVLTCRRKVREPVPVPSLAGAGVTRLRYCREPAPFYISWHRGPRVYRGRQLPASRAKVPRCRDCAAEWAAAHGCWTSFSDADRQARKP